MVTSPRTGRVAMMAGGTGGHVFPALAVAEELRRRGHEVTWIGTSRGLESRVVPAHGIDLDLIPVKGLRRSGILRLLMAPVILGGALWRAFAILRRRRPSLVVGMGGFVAGPGGVAARILGLPLVIHEQNAVAGLTNRLLSCIATRVLAAFPGAFPEKRVHEVTGNPVRPAISSLPEPDVRWAGRSGPLHVLVMGGSLGAQALNDRVPEALAHMEPGTRPRVRHQAGRAKAEGTRERYTALAVEAEVTEFIDEVAEALAWADLVICRAGALTVSELEAAGVASVLVPYPYAVDDHQTANGRFLSEAGAAELVAQRELSADGLAQWLGRQDRHGLLEMARRARSLAKPKATEQVANLCEELMA